MFGFLKPLCRSEKYRKFYCDSCSHLRQNYGRGATPFLSYESVLVHAMTFDAGLIHEEDTVSPCRWIPISKRPKTTSEVHQRIGEFSAALTLLLVKTKLEDDILDDGSRRAQLATWFHEKRFARAVHYFSGLDPDFERTMQGFLDRHREMELSGTVESLSEYAKPTADAFGYVFGLLGVAIEDMERRTVYENIGRQVGEAIICADCGRDWSEDRKKGLYNPVRTLEESAHAIAASQAALREGVEAARQTFGEDCVTEQILLGVHDRIYRQTELDKRYEKYLVPLRECSSLESMKEKNSQGIVLASCCAPPSAIHDPIGYEEYQQNKWVPYVCLCGCLYYCSNTCDSTCDNCQKDCLCGW